MQAEWLNERRNAGKAHLTQLVVSPSRAGVSCFGGPPSVDTF